jgi:very-short-patch-repair endonuclease
LTVPSRDPKRVKLARQFRQIDVPAEKKLWRELRRRTQGVKFRRQHPIGPYFADFACCERMLIVELDGESHLGSDAGSRDEKRTQYLEEAGWRVLRFWNTEVHDDLESVVETIYLICKGESEGPPHPALSPPQSRVERVRRSMHSGLPMSERANLQTRLGSG